MSARGRREKRTLDVPVLVPAARGFLRCRSGATQRPSRAKAPAAWRGPPVLLAVPVSSVDGTTADEEAAARADACARNKVRPGKVTKRIHLVDGEDVVYTQHVVEGFRGPAPVAHHATLALPETPRSVEIRVRSVPVRPDEPGVFSDPANREYQALAVNAAFDDLRKVPGAVQGPRPTRT